MGISEPITLVIFTCEGREHLLAKTVHSFFSVCNYTFEKVILSIDGPFSPQAIEQVNADVVLHSRIRRGYVKSISEVVKLIATPYFLWLEDDWIFHADPDISSVEAALKSNSNWVQIVYSKYGPLPEEYKKEVAGTGLYKHPFGFSANPCVCNTMHVQNAFRSLSAPPLQKSDLDGFESYLTRYFTGHDLVCVIKDPVDRDLITHAGYLESTAREFHMVNSLEVSHGDVPREYISGFGHEKKISINNKIAMLPKIILAALSLSVGMFKKREIYDYALRLYIAFQRNFKN